MTTENDPFDLDNLPNLPELPKIKAFSPDPISDDKTPRVKRQEVSEQTTTNTDEVKPKRSEITASAIDLTNTTAFTATLESMKKTRELAAVYAGFVERREIMPYELLTLDTTLVQDIGALMANRADGLMKQLNDLTTTLTQTDGALASDVDVKLTDRMYEKAIELDLIK